MPGSRAFRTRCYGAYGVGGRHDDAARTAFCGERPEPGVGWYLLGARPYVPPLRRFTAPDPFSPFDDGGWNRQAYCGGDPIHRVDPTGNTWWDWLATLGRATDAATENVAPALATPTMMSLADATPRPLVGTKVKNGYTRKVYEFRDGRSRIKHYDGRGAVEKKIPHRLEPGSSPSGDRIRTEWHSLVNRNGGVNHAADTNVSAVQIKGFMSVIGQKDDALPILLLSGVHGSPDGRNWLTSGRGGMDPALFRQDTRNLAVMAQLSRREPGDLKVVDIGKISTDDFVTLIDAPAHIVHGYCFGAADRLLMTRFNVGLVKTYEL